MLTNFSTFLGYLCLGANNTTSDSSSSALESLSAGSLALVNNMRERDEEVQVIHRVLDAGELHLMQASSCSAEVQTDFEPLWCLRNTPFSIDTRSEETTVNSAVLPVHDSTMIDLRNCDEFSVVHLEDVRDPSSQFVMLQTGGSVEVPAASAMALNNSIHSLPASHLPVHAAVEPVPELETQVPVEIVGAPAMFVGGSGRQWKRELELSHESEGLRQPANTDSGIWDMMQALGSSADNSERTELFDAKSERHGYSGPQVDAPLSTSITGIQPSLQGVYKMFQIADGSDNTESQQTVDEQVLSKSKSNVRQSCVGGLEDALEPLAVVDFIVHRVEAETVCMERIDSSDCKPTKDRFHPTVLNQNGRSNNETVRIPGQSKWLVDSAVGVDDRNKDYSDDSNEDDELALGSRVAARVNIRNGGRTVQTADSATNTPQMKKKHKDVIRVTSARFGRLPRRRVGGKGRGSWKDSNREARKSVSANVSRCSSLLDIDDDQQEMARSSDAFSDPSPLHGDCRDMKTGDQSLLLSRQPFSSSPCEWRHSGPAGVESHEWFVCGSTSTASGPMTSNLGLLAEPDLLNFEKFPDWMRDLPESMLHVPLSAICIPGKIFSFFYIWFLMFILL